MHMTGRDYASPCLSPGSTFICQTVRMVTCCLRYVQAALKHNEAKRSDRDTVYPVQANKCLVQVS